MCSLLYINYTSMKFFEVSQMVPRVQPQLRTISPNIGSSLALDPNLVRFE